MRQQITFQQQQFESDVKQFQSNSSNAHGTSRFGEQVRSKQMTFQNENSPEPNNDQSNISQQYNPKRASGSYFANYKPQPQFDSFSKSRLTCYQHGAPAKLVCITLGCSQGWLCESCTHDCPSVIPIEDYEKSLHLILENQPLEQIQTEKSRVHAIIKEAFAAVRQDFSAELEQIEARFMARLLNETLSQNEISSVVMRELFESDLRILETANVGQVQKFLLTNSLKVTDLSRIFIQDRSLLHRRLEKLRDQMQRLVNNFIENCISWLQDDIRCDLPSKHTPYQKSQLMLQQIGKLKETHQIRQATVLDFCAVSRHLLATASKSGEISLWKLPSYSKVASLQHGIECTSIAACQDECKMPFLLSAGREGGEFQIFLWNVEFRTRVGEVTGHAKQLRKIVPLPNQQLAWCQEDSLIRVWRLGEKRQVLELDEHSAWVNDLCMVGRQSLASCSRDQTVVVFDFTTGKVRFKIKDSTYVTCLVSLNDEHFAFANYNGYIKVYHTEVPQMIWQIQVSGGWFEQKCIWQMARLEPQCIAVQSVNGEITFISGGRIIRTIKCENVSALMWMSAYKSLMIASNDDVKVLQ